ncbi:unnamed protein product, partial [Staurois parvus]
GPPVPTPHAAARPVICHGPLLPPPHAAARPVICHGPLYRLLMLLPGPECVMGPCTASHCCCLHRHTLPCATFRSPHTAGGFHFVIGCCMASHCCCLHRHTVAPHSGFGPVTAQMSEVCEVILRSTALICMSYLLTVLVLFPSRLQGHLN